MTLYATTTGRIAQPPARREVLLCFWLGVRTR